MDFFFWLPFIVVFLIILIFAKIVLFLGIKDWKEREDKVRKLGRQLGFKLEKHSFPKPSTIRGMYKSRETEIMSFQCGQGYSSTSVIKFVMLYSPRSGKASRDSSKKPVVLVTPRVFSIAGKRLSSASKQYNDTFITHGSLAKELVDSRVQDQLIQLNKVGGAILEVDAPKAGGKGQAVFMTSDKFVADKDFAGKVLELLEYVSEKIEGSH